MGIISIFGREDENRAYANNGGMFKPFHNYNEEEETEEDKIKKKLFNLEKRLSDLEAER